MSQRWFEYDPFTGITERYEQDDNGVISITPYQDIQPFLDHAAALRNEGMTDEAWKKNGAALYAIIPPVVQSHMAKKGIRYLDPNHIQAVLREINTNYEYLKTTSKHHDVRYR